MNRCSKSNDGEYYVAIDNILYKAACGIMENYRKTSHSVYDIKYHLVWITKYRKPVLLGEVAERVRELVREQCKSMDIDIVRGHVSRDQIHLFVSVPPQHSTSNVMQKIKGKTSHKMLLELKTLQRKFWGRHLWARGYFAASSDNVTDEVIIKYIEDQNVDDKDGDFRAEDK